MSFCLIYLPPIWNIQTAYNQCIRYLTYSNYDTNKQRAWLNSLLQRDTSLWFILKLLRRNTLHYCGISMEISSERNAHWGDTDLRVERIRNSADCEQVLDKKPLSHDKLNIELWGLAKLRTIQSPIHSFSAEILKECDYNKVVLYKGMESLRSSLTFSWLLLAVNVCIS